MALLSRTSKMGCHSWSLPAGPGVCAGFMAGTDSVCGSCYAAQGMYHMPNVKAAQADRLRRWREEPTIDCELVAEICRKRGQYFRVFDSGDFSSIDDVHRWRKICTRCPGKQFWIPTRTWRLGLEWRAALARLHDLPNVCVRYSGLRWGETPPEIRDSGTEAMPITTLVTDGSGDCPAMKERSSCETEGCRKCWESKNAETRIDRHGNRVNWTRRVAA